MKLSISFCFSEASVTDLQFYNCLSETCRHFAIMAIATFSQDSRQCVIFKSLIVALVDNDSEDEGTSKTKAEEKAVEPEEVAGEQGEQEDDDGEADDDEEEAGEDDSEVSQPEGGADSSSEGEGRQTASTSMSSRSESKPYSSVTHKCEVRNIRPGCRRG